MTRADALAELIAKVEAGGVLRSSQFIAMSDDPDCIGWARQAHSGSLDAALALHQAVLPGWGWRFNEWYGDDVGEKYRKKCAWVSHPRSHYVGHCVDFPRNGNPARAWLLSILKALHAQEQETTQ